MKSSIRKIMAADKPIIMEMMRVFYASPAVHTNGSEEIFSADIDNCVNENPYLEGYVIENSLGIQGYSMVAKSFSTEFGKPCIWIEDLYIKSEYRGQGLGKALISYVLSQYQNCIFRLEAEEDNLAAINLYKQMGFNTALPYIELKK